MNSNIKLPKNMTTCRWCHEPIMVHDKICKHCNEYQNDIEQHIFENKLLNDSTLSTLDWIIILVFQFIGFGLGSAYLINGEKIRGLKVIVYSFISVFINLTIVITNYGIYKYFTKLLSINLL